MSRLMIRVTTHPEFTALSLGEVVTNFIIQEPNYNNLRYPYCRLQP